MSAAADRKYHVLHPVDAVVDAWAEPGIDRRMHVATRREITRLSPQLGRALDRLARHDPAVNRADVARSATAAVSLALLTVDPGSGDGDDERWRKATAIVVKLIDAGLI